MYPIASEETYQDGQVIFKEGSSGDWIYVILSGAVEVYKTVGGKEIIIDKLLPGEVVGELSFIAGIKRTASVRAVGETTLGIIDRGILDEEFNQIPANIRPIITSMATRFNKLLERTTGLSAREHPRFSRTLSLTYKDRESFVKAFTDNISNGGLFVRSRNPLDQGEEFLLKLQLPCLSEPLSIQCNVVWTRKEEDTSKGLYAGMGIKFMGMSEKDHEALKKVLGH